jgi:OFA family oxalate/formate antiporter-like MFS transporter
MTTAQAETAPISNRWLVVVGAILIQLCLGAIYAWSVFTPTLQDAGMTKTQTQAIFSAGLASFAVVMVIAGRLMPKLGPRMLAILGGIVLGIGYELAGFLGGTEFTALFVFIGLIGGAGIGLAYVVPIAVGMRWFPDKKGLVTGLAVAGFGFGATLWVKLAGSWGNLIANQGISSTFIIYGIVFAAMCIIGSLWMVYPPANWKPEGWSPETAAGGSSTPAAAADFTSAEMLRTAQFWMIWLCFVIGAGAGLMAIGLMKLFPMEALQSAGIEEAAASAIAGTAMGVFYALFNGFGRIAWGWISDRTGRKAAIVAMLGIQGVIVILFQFMAGQQYLLYLGAALIGFNFGGNFALFPTITADTFGQKFFSQNYGWVFLAYGVGGILFPILGGRLGDMGNFPLAFSITGILCLVAAGIAFMIRPPKAAT